VAALSAARFGLFFALVDPIEDRVSHIATATLQKDDSIRPIILFIYWWAPEWTTMPG
jgi:hypothetical protein